MKPTAVVLLSGGMDSAVLLWHVKASGKVPFALSFDYGQRHVCELERAAELAEIAEVSWVAANLQPIQPLISKGSQTGVDLPPDGHYTEMSMKTTIVPNRNAIMLSIAVGFAIAHEMEHVYYAAHGGDHTIYPDCRPEFFDAFSRAMILGNGWDLINLHAPFIHRTKEGLVRLGTELGVPFEKTWSCYKGSGQNHCGTCGTCVERREAFQLAKVPDPTQYEAEFVKK
jgi:7-cyano-7-deazaguanine synthase